VQDQIIEIMMQDYPKARARLLRIQKNGTITKANSVLIAFKIWHVKTDTARAFLTSFVTWMHGSSVGSGTFVDSYNINYNSSLMISEVAVVNKDNIEVLHIIDTIISSKPVLSFDNQTIYICSNIKTVTQYNVERVVGQLTALHASDGREKWSFQNPQLEPIILDESSCPTLVLLPEEHVANANGPFEVAYITADSRRAEHVHLFAIGPDGKDIYQQDDEWYALDKDGYLEFIPNRILSGSVPCSYKKSTGGSVCDYHPIPRTVPALVTDNNSLAQSILMGTSDASIYRLNMSRWSGKNIATSKEQYSFTPFSTYPLCPQRNVSSYCPICDADTNQCPGYPTGSAIRVKPVLSPTSGAAFIGGSDGKLFAIDTKSSANVSELLWIFDTGAPIYNSPRILQDGSLLYVYSNTSVFALHAQNGTLNWTCTLICQNVICSSSRIDPNAHPKCDATNDYILDMYIPAGDAQRQSHLRGAPHQHGPLANPYATNPLTIYLSTSSSQVTAIGARTGSILWTQKASIQSFSHPVPSLIDDKNNIRVYVTSKLGEIIAFNCSDDSHIVLDRRVYVCPDLSLVPYVEVDLCSEHGRTCFELLNSAHTTHAYAPRKNLFTESISNTDFESNPHALSAVNNWI
jgi:outer membrane protein assembly factor BamB